MKVINLKTNKIEEVNDSYAVNFLIPKGLVKAATERVLKARETAEEQKLIENDHRDIEYTALAKSFDGRVIKIKSKANDKGDLFGSITKNQIKKSLGIKQSVEIKMTENIKHLGDFPLTIKFGKHKAVITLKVINS